ncbi:MAG: ATP-binding protein [Nitrospiria bacterium]
MPLNKKNFFQPVSIILLFLVISVSLTILLFRGVESPSLFSTNILVVTMVNLNIILVILLILFLSRNLVKFYFERRKEPNRSSLKSKLVLALVGLSMIPSILLFLVASGLLTSSVENWFSIQVERSLNQSLEIAQDYYLETQRRVAGVSEQIGRLLLKKKRLKTPREALIRFLDGRKEEHNLHHIFLFTHDFQLFAESSGRETGPALDPFYPSSEFLKESIEPGSAGASPENKPIPSITSTPQGDLVRSIFPLTDGGRMVSILVVEQLIPSLLVGKMEGIRKSVEEYKQLKAFKNPIKGSYIISFLIIVFLIIFSATWFGLYLAKSITIPIQELAEGTQAVAQGDLNFKIEVRATDELGVLVSSFNKMTDDLKGSQEKIAATTRSLIASNRELEGVLQNIATGVISINEKGIITTFNPSAEKILDVQAKEAIQASYIDFFSIRGMEGITHPLKKMQKQSLKSLEEGVILEVHKRLLTLRMSLSMLHGANYRFLGFVIVFDDLTELIRAQKMATWQEVARQIAHEIKNPLTPIQLSTERLRKKYFEHAPDFDSIFDESTRIVINEVHGLKTLVDEFSDFARLPPPHCTLQGLDPILREAVSLYKRGHQDVLVKTDLEEDIPMINLDREQLKRVFINLFDNAVEAMEGRGTLQVSTAYDPTKKKIRVAISDEGSGIDPEDLDKLFLPYFSRKKTGTGLGLAIVNRIVTDHNAQIRVGPNEPKGTTFTIDFPV